MTVSRTVRGINFNGVLSVIIDQPIKYQLTLHAVNEQDHGPLVSLISRTRMSREILRDERWRAERSGDLELVSPEGVTICN
jgi:hypothetical protein